MPDLKGSQRYYSEGRRAKLFLREETSYGQAYSSSNNDFISRPLGIVPGTVITKDSNYIQPDVLTGSPSMVEGLLGKTTVGGSYAFYIDYPRANNHTTIKLLKHAFGMDSISTGNSSTYYTLDQDLPTAGLGFLQILEPSGNPSSVINVSDVIVGKDYKIVDLGNLAQTGATSWNTLAGTSNVTYPVNYVINVVSNGPSGTTAKVIRENYFSQVAYFNGTRINGLTINVPSIDSAVTMAFDFMCKDGDFYDESDTFTLPGTISNYGLNTWTLDGEKNPNYFPAWSTEVILQKLPLQDPEVEYHFAFSNLSLNFNNNLQPISFIDGNDSVTDFNRGRRNVNGSFTLPLFHTNATTNTTQFLKEFFEGANYQLLVRLHTERDNKWIEFTFPNIVWSTSPAPRNLNQGHAELNMNFIAYPEKDTSGTGFKKNTEFKLRIN